MNSKMGWAGKSVAGRSRFTRSTLSIGGMSASLIPTKKEENKMTKLFKKFVQDEKGLETVEYAVMTALIVAALIGAVGALSLAVTGRFEDVEGTIGLIV